MRAVSMGGGLGSAAAAAVVAAAVPWLVRLWPQQFGMFDNLPFAVVAVLASLVGAAAFAAVLVWGTRGLAGAWALLLGVYGWMLAVHTAPWRLSGDPPLPLAGLPYALCTALPRVAADWAPFAAGLFLATWVARFRDGRAGFGALLLPAALGAAGARSSGGPTGAGRSAGTTWWGRAPAPARSR